MTTRNLDQLVARVLKNMNHLRPGEDADEETAADVKEIYRETHARLLDQKVAYWPWQEIPLQVFSPLAWLVAIEVAPSFGAMPIVLQALAAGNADAARDSQIVKMRDHVVPEFNEERMSEAYF